MPARSKKKKEDGSDPLIDRTIVLVGLMGAGKTTIGRRLAGRLHLPFLDADAEIERAAGCTVQEIFDKHGEAEFRRGEESVILRLISGPPRVVATGGGAFVNPRIRAGVKDRAIAIWLRADIPVLVERVKRKDTRPLLKTGDPERILTRLAAEREPYYAEADIVVDSADAPHEDVVDAIVAKLGVSISKAANP